MARPPRNDETRARPPKGIPRLFDAGELRLRATGEARLRALARVPPRRSLSSREARAEQDLAVLRRLQQHAADLAPRFRLRYASIEAEQDGVNEHYGICYADGVIRIRLRHAVTGRHLKESSLVDTLCHELAHLRYFDHSIRFRRLYRRILDEARRLGYYRPGPTDDGPRQGDLFGLCGVREGTEIKETEDGGHPSP